MTRCQCHPPSNPGLADAGGGRPAPPPVAAAPPADGLQGLIHEHAALVRALAGAQVRCQQLADEHARLLQAHEDELQHLRAKAWVREAEIAHLRQRLAEWQPGAAAAPVAPLADRAVLCVGARPASVPLYRLVVERAGARFLHHDGGERDNQALLEATLAAADLVICQTGCLSHNAHWRVEDHCRRTGKRCVLLQSPGRVALQKALAQAGGPADDPPA